MAQASVLEPARRHRGPSHAVRVGARAMAAGLSPCKATAHLSRVTARAIPGAVVLALVLSIPQVATPVPSQAACGTRWDSRVVPPPSIRVYRTASRRVETVDFKVYVANVMASGEWPSSMPVAELEAGAVAVKQFAWYYALEGHHRDTYRTTSGICFDVRDDTSDQLYRPERADPTAKQIGAVERTWGLSLRKRGRFFLTGYRAGSARRCAADADGWKLYARSVRDCAERLGWSRERIQQAYYAPNFEEVWAPGIGGPVASAPSLRVDARTTFPGSGLVSWPRARSTKEIVRYRLQRRVNGGAWRDVRLTAPTATRASVPLWADRTYRFRVRARDEDGTVGFWAAGPRVTARLREPDETRLVGGDWYTVEATGATGGSTTISGTQGHRVEVRFTGRAVGYLATTGPGRGHARIFVNGREVALVDLEAGAVHTRQLVWARNWDGNDERVVAVEVAEQDAPIEVDAFLVLR